MSFWYLATVVSAFVRLKKENSKFEDSLIYIPSSRLFKATRQDLVSKIKYKKKE